MNALALLSVGFGYGIIGVLVFVMTCSFTDGSTTKHPWGLVCLRLGALPLWPVYLAGVGLAWLIQTVTE